MRPYQALCDPEGRRGPWGLRARVRRLLCLTAAHQGDARLDPHPGVWLKSFQSLDCDAHAQVGPGPLLMLRHVGATVSHCSLCTSMLEPQGALSRASMLDPPFEREPLLLHFGSRGA
ncbi:unnamed protein product [Arctogadus glacialis]